MNRVKIAANYPLPIVLWPGAARQVGTTPPSYLDGRQDGRPSYAVPVGVTAAIDPVALGWAEARRLGQSLLPLAEVYPFVTRFPAPPVPIAAPSPGRTATEELIQIPV